MGRSCFVPKCKTNSSRKENKYSLFKPPKDEKRLNEWRRLIPRKDRVLSNKDFVCERHFQPEYVKKEKKVAEWKGNVLMEWNRVAKLTDDAIPTIFPDLPVYLTKKITKRKPPKDRSAISLSEKKKSKKNVTPEKGKSNKEITILDLNLPTESLNSNACVIPPNLQTNLSIEKTTAEMPTDKKRTIDIEVLDNNQLQTDKNLIKKFTFDDLWKNYRYVKLPAPAWNVHKFEKGSKRILLYVDVTLTFDFHSYISKELRIQEGLITCVNIAISPTVVPFFPGTEIKSLSDVENLLVKLHEVNVCPGAAQKREFPDICMRTASVDNLGVWRHNDCLKFSDKRCKPCSTLRKSLGQSATRRMKKNERKIMRVAQ